MFGSNSKRNQNSYHIWDKGVFWLADAKGTTIFDYGQWTQSIRSYSPTHKNSKFKHDVFETTFQNKYPNPLLRHKGQIYLTSINSHITF